jgi:outer membrane murein-binding lipoprotein Lpp
MSHQKGAISTTSLTDVVFHSGNRYANASHGTKIWSLLIAANKPLFFTLTKGRGEEQVRLAASIVHAVTTVGGRFLVRDKSSGLYYNVGATCAQDSTHFALGGSEPHYAETLEEIARARQLHRAQCDYFEDPKDDALGKKVHTLVAKELDRLFHQAQHVEQSSTTNLASSVSQHGNANKTWSSTLGEKNRKVAAAAAAEAFTSGGNEQQEQDEAATNVKQVSALVESCHDDDAHHNNNHNEEATQKEEPQHENSSDSSETVNQMREKHTLEEHAILEKEDHNEDSTTKRQRVDQE